MSDEKENENSEVKDSEALERSVGSGGRQRFRSIDDYVEAAEKGAPDEGRKLPRGRTGVSRGKSPKNEEKNSD